MSLHRRREHGGAHYLAGLAAECILRAYYLRIKPESEEYYAKHDLVHLAHLGELDGYLPREGRAAAEMKQEFNGALSDLRTRWRNRHKYLDQEALARWLHSEARVDEDAKPAERVRVSGYATLEAALEIVTIGRLAWRRPRAG